MARVALDSVVACLTSAKNTLRLDYVVDYVLPKGVGGDEAECEDCKV